MPPRRRIAMNRREFLETTCLAGTGAALPGVPSDAGKRLSAGADTLSAADDQDEFYIAVDGNDRNGGTKSEPFATMGRAVEAVRALRKQTNLSIKVWVRSGTYYFPEPIVFGPLDSGGEHSVVYAAYPGERVTLSGGKKLECR